MSDFKEMSTQKDIELSKLLNERDTLEKQVQILQIENENLNENLQKMEREITSQSQELNTQ